MKGELPSTLDTLRSVSLRTNKISSSKRSSSPTVRRPDNTAVTDFGLSIYRRLVEILGGRIRVQNEPGTGGTFSVYIPLDQAGDLDSTECDGLHGLNAVLVCNNLGATHAYRGHLVREIRIQCLAGRRSRCLGQ